MMIPTDDKTRGDLLVGCMPALFAYVRRLVGDREMTSDVVQEVSLRALTGGGPRDSENFLAWSCGIARNVIGSEWRRRRRVRIDQDHDEHLLDEIRDPKAAPDRIADARVSLERAMGDDSENVALLVRRYVGKVSGKTLAAELGLTPAALRMRLMRIRSSVRARRGEA